ncbi:MAG: hypothetical protein AAF585_00895, partial [Verrucomicrobiota bacterium]
PISGGGYEFYFVAKETSVVVGNRLPKAGVRNVVHLVSLEDRYDATTGKFDETPPPCLSDSSSSSSSSANVTLTTGELAFVSLHSWEFFCDDASHTFKWALEGLNSVRFPVVNGQIKNSALPASIDVPESFKGATITSPPLSSSSSSSSSTANQLPETLFLVSEKNETIGKIVPSSGDWSTAAGIDSNGRITIHGESGASSGSSGSGSTLGGVILDYQDQTKALFQLPTAGSGPDATKYLEAGFVPLRHQFRQGSKSVSWYSGPLIPNPASATTTARKSDYFQSLSPVAESLVKKMWEQDAVQGELTVAGADQLLIYDENSGMFDASYAAAWQLGRTLALEHRAVAVALFEWKRRHAASLHSARLFADHGYRFPIGGASTALSDSDTVPVINQWFEDLTLLRHVPFAYLAPNDLLLPPESMRFFSVDPLWLECLRDGAFSIGRVRPNDVDHDALVLKPKAPIVNAPISGMLIRSSVVSGWPQLRIEVSSDVPKGSARDDSALPESDSPINILRQEVVGPDTLLCLFDGEVRTADVFLPPELLHFGFDVGDAIGQSGNLHTLEKKLRDKDGNQEGSPVPNGNLGIEATTRRVDFNTLAASILTDLPSPKPTAVAEPGASSSSSSASTLNPAIFALEMVSGVEKVRFIRNLPPATT